MTEINKSCEIVNNSGSEVVVLDVAAINDPETLGALFEQPLTALLTAAGSSIIAAAERQIVELNDTQIDPDTQESVYSTFYNLILAAPLTLFPIKNTTVLLDMNTKSYPDVTPTVQDKDQTNLAYQFYQIVLANPTANLTINLVDALYQILDEATSVDEINSIMANYFQQNATQYQSLDLNSLAAVISYMEMYACVWAAHQSSYTYYLYAASSAIDTSISGLTSQAPNDIGRLFLVQKATTGTLDPSDYNSAYDISFQPADGSAEIPLVYDHGQFVSSTSDADPIVSLQASFIMKRQLSLIEEDTQLIRAIAGMINGQYVLGVDVDQSDAGTGWYSFWHPTTLLGMSAGTLGIIIGVVIGLVILVGAVWTIKMRIESSSDELTPEKLEQYRDLIRENIAKKAASEQLKVDQYGGHIEIPVDQNSFTSLMSKFTRAGKIELINLQSNQQLEELVNLKEQVDILAQVEITPEISALYATIEALNEGVIEANIALERAITAKDSELLDTAIKESQTLLSDNREKNIPDVQKSVRDEYTKVESKLSDGAKQDYANHQKAIETSQAFEKTLDDEEKDIEDGTIPDDIDPSDESFA